MTIPHRVQRTLGAELARVVGDLPANPSRSRLVDDAAPMPCPFATPLAQKFRSTLSRAASAIMDHRQSSY
jgi:hypothetical protein